MAAIITDEFRRDTTRALLDAIIEGSNDFYVGIGKSDIWDPANDQDNTVPIPNGSVVERQDVLSNLATLVQINASNSRYVIPYIKASIGRRYKAYDSTDPTCFYASVDGGITTYPCYAMNGNRIYLCLVAGAAELPDLPTTDDYDFFTLGDYTWVLIAPYELGSPFNTAQFTAVVKDPRLTADPALPIPDITKGRIYGITIVNPGTAYTSLDKFRLVGDGADPDIELPITDVTFGNGGAVGAIDLPLDVLSGYTKASVVVTRNTPVGAGEDELETAVQITPINGFGYDPVGILMTWFAGLAVSVSGLMDEDAFISSYRQISVIKNPQRVADVGDVGPESLDAMRYFVLSAAPDPVITPADGLVGMSSAELVDDEVAPKCFIDAYKLIEGEHRVYFHTNHSPLVNEKPFPAVGDPNGLTIDGVVYPYTEIREPEYVRGTGTVLFLENRKPIVRANTQTEELKIVIQF
jgi:hypothetical protein